MGVGLFTIRKTIINYLLRIKGRQSENRPPKKAVRFQLSYKQINTSSSLVEKKKRLPETRSENANDLNI